MGPSAYETSSKMKNSHSGPTYIVSAIPVERRYSSARFATLRGSFAYGAYVPGSTISQTSDSVGTSVNGSRIAVDASGMRIMSLSSIPCQPRIDEPSKPRPSSNADSSRAPTGSVTCCHVPSRSQNLRSTIETRVSAAHSSASRASGSVSPPFVR